MGWQPLGLTYPDAEAVVVDAIHTLLLDAGEDVKVARAIPRPRAPRMVAVNRDGGSIVNGVDQTRIRLRVWGESPENATDLARLVIALAPRMVDDGTATNVRHLSGPLDVPDQSGQPQRYVLLEIHLEAEGEPA